jgi:hypothetical protein
VNGKIDVGVFSNGIRSHLDARCSSSCYCSWRFPLNVSSYRSPTSLGRILDREAHNNGWL